MLKLRKAIIFTFAMGVVIFFCRFVPFLFFRDREMGSKKGGVPLGTSFLGLVEKVAPPVAMTVLAFNALSASFKEDLSQGVSVFFATAFTVVVHLWKRNSLLSISGGTLVYMLIIKIIL